MNAWAVVDLGFGDAGKGAVVDALVRRTGADLVVRANGGAQAGHNVVTPEGGHHTFSQFGAASFVPGVETLLGPDFLIHPLGMAVEADHLHRAGLWGMFDRTWIDVRARVITPWQQAANRAFELARGDAAHGTCGLGVGECVRDALSNPELTIRALDLFDRDRCRRLLELQRDHKLAEVAAVGPVPEIFQDAGLIPRVLDAWSAVAGRMHLLHPESTAARIRHAGGVVFEGAQGVLLDEWWGLHPHTTWSDCTFAPAEALCDRPISRIGVVRAYQTRHGPGPLPSEAPLGIPELHNQGAGPQGAFRQGHLDLLLLDHALRAVGGVHGLAVNHLDRARGASVVTAYRTGAGRMTEIPLQERTDLQQRAELTALLSDVQVELEDGPVLEHLARRAPIVMRGYGPRHTDKVWSVEREWGCA